MVKIRIVHDGYEKKLIVSEKKPIRKVLHDSEIDYAPIDSVSLNGKKLSPEELKNSLLEFGLVDTAEITIGAGENVPRESSDAMNLHPGFSVCPLKVQIMGCACIIISEFSLDELTEMQKYMPEAMTGRDEKGEPVFAISIDEEGSGLLNSYGAEFSRMKTSQGKATITALIDSDCGDAETWVKEKLGSAILSLIDLEEDLKKKLADLHERKNRLNNYISKM